MKQVISADIKKEFFDKLDERQKRCYAAIEAISLGYGGQSAVHRALGISVSALRKGISEVKQGDSVSANRIRKQDVGRKKRLTAALSEKN